MRAVAPGLLVVVALSACQHHSEPPPNILLLVLDTTRADRLGCYGYQRPTTPHLDRLGRDGVVLRNAWSTSSWTLPAVASILTGQYPTTHGAHFDPRGTVEITWAVRGEDSWRAHRAYPLDRSATTLPAVLGQRGWVTGGFAGGPWMKRVFGLSTGFAHYDDDGIESINGRAGSEITSRVLAWIDQRGSAPFFALVNYFEPHWPYRPPPSMLASVMAPGDDLSDEDGMKRARYDAEVRTMDVEVGRLLHGLRGRGLYDQTWVIAVGDHGELLGEYGTWGHGEHLTEEEVHVPLIVKPPRGARLPVRGDEPAQLVDLAPTLLAAVGLSVPASMQGAPLPRPGHPVYAELYPVPAPGSEGHWRLLVEGSWVYVWNSRGRSMLVERNRGRVEMGARGAAMAARLEELVASLPKADHPADTEAELRSLHYMP